MGQKWELIVHWTDNSIVISFIMFCCTLYINHCFCTASISMSHACCPTYPDQSSTASATCLNEVICWSVILMVLSFQDLKKRIGTLLCVVITMVAGVSRAGSSVGLSKNPRPITEECRVRGPKESLMGHTRYTVCRTIDGYKWATQYTAGLCWEHIARDKRLIHFTLYTSPSLRTENNSVHGLNQRRGFRVS